MAATRESVSGMGRFPRWLFRQSLERPRLVLALWVLLLAAATPGLRDLHVETSTDNVLDRRGPAWSLYQKSLETFGGDETLVVAIEGEQPFDPKVLRKLSELTRELQGLSGVRRVDSLSSLRLIRVDEDGSLDLTPALGSEIPEDAAGLALLRARVENDRVAADSLVSADGRVFAINVLLEAELDESFEAVVTHLRESVAAHGAWVSGVPVFRIEVNIHAGREIALFVALTVLLVAILVYSIFGSVVAVVLPLCIGGIGTFLTLATMGSLGVPLTLSTVILPSIMLALGCAYSTHLLSAALGSTDVHQLRQRLGPVMRPTLLSGLTTTIGFVAIASIRIDAIQQVGGFGALGVISITFAILTVAPALLRLLPSRAPETHLSRWLSRSLHPQLLRLAESKRRIIFGVTSIGFVAFGLGLANVTLETDATRWFPHGSEVRDSYEQIRERLSGISPMNVFIEAPPGRTVLEPAALSAIDALSHHLASLPEVGKSISVADPLRQIHGGFSGDESEPLPAEPGLTEQYILLLEGLEPLRDLLSPAHDQANIVLRVDNNGSAHLLGLADEVERWWSENGPEGYRATSTGIMYEFARAQDAISLGQIRGLSLALFVIALIFAAIFRSVRVAILGLIPNITPIVIAYGFMGIFGIPLDAGTVIIGSLAIGIAVDDTVHVLTSIHERARRGVALEVAVSDGLAQVLPAITYSTIIIGIGFGVLCFSSFTITRNVGIFVSAVMVICYFADLILLPALLNSRGYRAGFRPSGISPSDLKAEQ